MLCYNCFKEVSSISPCPYCGYDGKSDSEKYPQALPCGSILNGRYTVGRVLGQGGFGITYIAQDYKTRELVAIKEYFPHEDATRGFGANRNKVYAGDREESFKLGKGLFFEEAKTFARFRENKNICRVDRYFEENNTAYIVLEYVNGVSLDKYMTEHGGKLSVDEVNSLLIPVMDALTYMHSKEVFPIDTAPDNVIITEKSNAVLLGSKLAENRSGKTFNIPLKHGFAPPEQYTESVRKGPYTDVYSLAATYYYAITGKIPPAAIERADDDEIVMPSTLGVKINPHSEDALMKAMAYNPSERFQSIREFKD